MSKSKRAHEIANGSHGEQIDYRFAARQRLSRRKKTPFFSLNDRTYALTLESWGVPCIERQDDKREERDVSRVATEATEPVWDDRFDTDALYDGNRLLEMDPWTDSLESYRDMIEEGYEESYDWI